ncbi:MAG TPA: hypothetical protein VH275_04555 [Solirubrobacterales bacterium]|jgi:hypothetical protein|nr:hypothetical protein [Solirubrobacterales bacterium]
MDDSVQWPNADITWSREQGYTLRLPLWADSRALSLREDEVIKAINEAMPGRSRIVTSLSPMVLWEDTRSSNSEPGEIAIGTETIITVTEARELRDGIAEALHGATEEAERAVAADKEAADEALSILREPSS